MTWTDVHTFVLENEWLQQIIITLLTMLITRIVWEIAVRISPTKAKLYAPQVTAFILEKIMDKLRIKNNVKVITEEGKEKVVDINPKNHPEIKDKV